MRGIPGLCDFGNISLTSVFNYCGHKFVIFNVLLPVHLAIFLAENQLDAPLLINLFILFLFFNSLHVSGTMCPKHVES
jgi:hypothetical protein